MSKIWMMKTKGLVGENKDESFDFVDDEVGAEGTTTAGKNETPFGTFKDKTRYAQNENKEFEAGACEDEKEKFDLF